MRVRGTITRRPSSHVNARRRGLPVNFNHMVGYPNTADPTHVHLFVPCGLRRIPRELALKTPECREKQQGKLALDLAASSILGIEIAADFSAIGVLLRGHSRAILQSLSPY